MTTLIDRLTTRRRSWFSLTPTFCGGLFLVMLLWGCGRNGVTVGVANSSGGRLNDVQIRFTGGTESLQSLAQGESRKCVVNPSGESSLMVEFTDAEGRRYTNKVDVYIEHDYKDRISITIGPSNMVEWTTRVRI